MRGAVYEVRPGDYGGGETDGRTVERGDENFWVCVEGVCYFDVVGDEGGEPGFTEVGAGGKGAGEGYICAAVCGECGLVGMGRVVERREVG